MLTLVYLNQWVIIITPRPVGGSMDAFVTHALEGEPPDEAPEEIGWVAAPDAAAAVSVVEQCPWADQLWGSISAIPRRRDAIGHALLKPLSAEVAPHSRGRGTHLTSER